jgi:hypothetical protein
VRTNTSANVDVGENERGIDEVAAGIAARIIS